jgi:NOL1/NOP2/fmu family ribosome biogenesis protein
MDTVIVDVPCSGYGIIRKKPDIRYKDPDTMAQLPALQLSIIHNQANYVRPGGLMIYSTCTFNHDENEKNAQWIADELGADILPIAYDPQWGITEGKPGYHFYPHKTKGEGFYLCAFRKHGIATGTFRIPKQKNPTSETVEFKDIMRSWLKHPDQWTIRQQDRFVVAYPAKYKQLIEFLNSQFICISTGFGIGELRGKTVVPQHALAMLKDLNISAFNKVELSLDQALSYLRCEALSLPNATAGVLLLTYENIPLGFVKNVGNHCNNLYPKEWRIRKL